MIRFKVLKQKDIHDNFLDGFVRHQETTKVKFYQDGGLIEKDIQFEDIWDEKKLTEVTEEFREIIQNKGVVIGVFDGNRVIGFSTIQLPLFKGYIDIGFIHISKEFRGKRLGKELFYRTALEAKKLGADKLYISAHPAIETQGFYESCGCILAEYIHPELLAREPYDIQLEFDLDYNNIFKRFALQLMRKPYVSSTVGNKIMNKLFRLLPENEYAFLGVCKHFMNQDNISLYSIATNWLKKRSEVIKMSNFKYFEDLLFNYVHGWGEVDQICYRALNPLIELQDSNYEYLLKWSDSKNKDVRRASLVSMIRSSGRLTLEYDYDKMIHLVEKLKHDEDFHVRKAVGWVLKCAYPTYPDKVEKYLCDNVDNLERMIFRYALEHAPKEIKERLMNLS